MERPPTYEDLVARAEELGFRVVSCPKKEIPGGWNAECSPATLTIWMSSSLADDRGPGYRLQCLAHEIGHAEQWNELGPRPWFESFRDPILRFNDEMDAVERGRRMGVDMAENWKDNYYGYMDDLGLEHLGRS